MKELDQKYYKLKKIYNLQSTNNKQSTTTLSTNSHKLQSTIYKQHTNNYTIYKFT